QVAARAQAGAAAARIRDDMPGAAERFGGVEVVVEVSEVQVRGAQIDPLRVACRSASISPSGYRNGRRSARAIGAICAPCRFAVTSSAGVPGPASPRMSPPAVAYESSASAVASLTWTLPRS